MNAAIRLTATAACLAALAGCNFAPDYAPPGVQAPAAFKELPPGSSAATNGWKLAEPRDGATRGLWWEIFGLPELNRLELQATTSNLNVAAAQANFRVARAAAKQAWAQYFPTLGVGPSVFRTKPVTAHGAAGSTPAYTEYALPFDVSWEPDLWGNVRNTVLAAEAGAQASAADLESLRLTMQAEVAADFFQIRALDEQKSVLDAAVAAYRESLGLTQARRETGIASDQDVAQAEIQLNLAHAQATDLVAQRAQLEHALAALLGIPAADFTLPAGELPAAPAAIPPGMPSQLLERRPDIAAAERRVAAANAQIGVARAAYFPALTLSGAAGYQGFARQNLLTGPNLVWSVGAALSETLFDAGRRDAIGEQARAAYEGAVADYRQTVLSAFQEVEDNLVSVRILTQEIGEQDAAVASSQRYLDLANERYKLGIDSYLNVITAQTTLLGNRRAAIDLRMRQLVSCAQLVKALGGGWENLRPEIAAYRFVREIPIAGDGGWDYLSVDAAARRLYVTHGGSVVAVDLGNNSVVGAITNTPGVHGLALAPELRRGFASNGRENTVSIVDLVSLHTLARIPVGENPDAILYEPSRREVYAFNGRGRSVTVLDAVSNVVVDTVALPGKPEFAAADPELGRVYCNLEDHNAVAVLDTRTHRVVATWPTAPGAEPAGMAIDCARHRLFLGCHNRLTVLMNAMNGTVLASMPIGEGVDANAFDPATRLAFSSCGDGTLAIAREGEDGALTPVQSLTTEPGARTLALDPQTHRIYLASARFEPPPDVPAGAPRPRPRIIPGSLRILVYDPVVP